MARDHARPAANPDRALDTIIRRGIREVRSTRWGTLALCLYIGLPVACQWGAFDSLRQGQQRIVSRFDTRAIKEIQTLHDSYLGEANWQPVLKRQIRYTDGTTGTLIYHYHIPMFGGFGEHIDLHVGACYETARRPEQFWRGYQPITPRPCPAPKAS